MAKPIELGLVLEGRDAEKFNDYIKNPKDTPQGRAMMERAERLAKQLKW